MIAGPPDKGAMDEHDAIAAWIERTAADLLEALADPSVRARVLALLDGHERDGPRRLEAARAEVAGLEVRWRLKEGGMQQLLNGVATLGLAVTAVTLIALLLGWAQSREGD
jgi:hypothetical protein